MDDFFSQLEAEITKSLAETATKAQAKKAKEKANNRFLPAATRAAAAEEYHQLQARIEAQEWASVSTVALFNEQTCDGCGSVHRVFVQYMEKQCMIRKPTTQRWLRTPAPLPNLPRESMIQPHITHICPDCCEDHGFALLDAPRLAKTEPLSLSTTYHQEDINAASL